MHFGHQRVEAKKFSRWNETYYGLFLIAVEIGTSNNSGDQQINELCLFILVKDDLIFLQMSNGQIVRKIL